MSDGEVTVLDEMVEDWDRLQVRYNSDDEKPFEVRLPEYDLTDNLMSGKGENVDEAVVDLVGKIRDVEGEDAYEIMGGEKRDPFNFDGTLASAPAGEGSKFHLFPNKESFCGRVELDLDSGVMDPEDVPDDEEICKLCIDQAPDGVTDNLVARQEE